MHPKCQNCPIGKCCFEGRSVKTAISCCQFIPILSGEDYLGSLTEHEQNAVVRTRPGIDIGEEYAQSLRNAPSIFKGKAKELDAEKISRLAIYGSVIERLNLN